MKTVLLLAPGMDGPQGHPYNASWPADLDRMVERHRWKVVTPSLLLLAAIAEQEGFEATVVDEDFAPAPTDKTFDLVCMYTVTPNAKRAYRYAEAYRLRGSWVAMGGVHSSFLEMESRRFADTLLIGEGEYIFRSFLRDFLRGKPESRYFQPLASVNLEDSPIPFYKSLRPEEQALVPMQTARGCPHQCRFCNVGGLYGGAFRKKPSEHIALELEAIRRLPKAKRVYLTNDNLLSSAGHASELFALFKETDFIWYANTDIGFGTEENRIRTAYQSGLRQVLICLEGVTAGELENLDPRNFKSRHAVHYSDYIERIQSNGIGVTGSFIVGRGAESPDTWERLEEFIDKTHLYAANITVCTPYPGTQLYTRMQRQGKRLSDDWNEYTIFHPVMPFEKEDAGEWNRAYRRLLEKVNTGDIQKRKLRYWMEIYKRGRGES